MIPGIDVSSYQGQIDWQKVAASGQQFAFIKATEGVGWKDPLFDRNWSEAHRVGIARGCYHFARPSRNTAQAEADYFLSVVGALEPGDLLALDIEDTAAGGDLSGWVEAWLAHVTSKVGFRPVIYTGGWYAGPHGLEAVALGAFGLWLSAYQSGFPAPLPGWPFVAIWQNGSTGQVDGIPSAVDTDFFNGDRAHLVLYGAPGAVAPTPAPQPAPPPPPPPVPVAGDVIVQPGQTLGGIAAAHGWDLGATERANPQLERGHQWGLIYPGDHVHAPAGSAPAPAPAPTHTYTVRAGDTLSGIAGRYGLTWRALWDLNRGVVSNPDVIYPGQALRVP